MSYLESRYALYVSARWVSRHTGTDVNIVIAFRDTSERVSQVDNHRVILSGQAKRRGSMRWRSITSCSRREQKWKPQELEVAVLLGLGLWTRFNAAGLIGAMLRCYIYYSGWPSNQNCLACSIWAVWACQLAQLELYERDSLFSYITWAVSLDW